MPQSHPISFQTVGSEKTPTPSDIVLSKKTEPFQTEQLGSATLMLNMHAPKLPSEGSPNFYRMPQELRQRVISTCVPYVRKNNMDTIDWGCCPAATHFREALFVATIGRVTIVCAEHGCSFFLHRRHYTEGHCQSRVGRLRRLNS